MDLTPAVLIFTPIFLPICQTFGMHPVQFGIMVTLNLCIGTITPPVGSILFTGAKVGNVKIEQVFKELLPYDITNCCRTYSVGREALWKNYYARRF